MINPVTFKEDYHNPNLSTREVAERHGIPVANLSHYARRLGILTRKDLNIRGQQKRLKRKLGMSGCNESCPYWGPCNQTKGREVLPCEIMVYLDENPNLIDNEPVYRTATAAEAVLNLMEIEK